MLGTLSAVAQVRAQTPSAVGDGAAVQMREVLYVMPIGTVPEDMPKMLTAYIEQHFNIPAKVLPRVSFNRNFMDYQRQQAVGERLIERMRTLHPLPPNQRALFIGLIAADIYSAATPEWLHTLALRVPNGQYALISTTRLEETFYGRSADKSLLFERVKKLAARQVEMLLLKAPANEDPQSVLFKDIKGVDDLDKMTKDY